MTEASHDQLASVVREHAGQLAATLTPVTGDFATAKDLVQDAVLAALQHWPMEGIPDRPDASGAKRGRAPLIAQYDARVYFVVSAMPILPRG